jgi:hypothetical protein
MEDAKREYVKCNREDGGKNFDSRLSERSEETQFLRKCK